MKKSTLTLAQAASQDGRMKFDLFQSICQNEVEGVLPSERLMFENFFRQVVLADQLGFDCAWVAESHLSSEVQKQNPGAVIPEFRGEIGLNTDILQLAQKVFAKTKSIHVGSAIRNILANGGPIAHAEAVRMFMTLHAFDPSETRRLELGFASGRFPYSNRPYGIRPRNEAECEAWPILKGLIFQEATEIFLRLLRGDVFASSDVRVKQLRADQFRSAEAWQKVLAHVQRLSGENGRSADREATALAPKPVRGSGGEVAIEIASIWEFERLGVIPREAKLDLLRLTIGAHDAETQALANQYLPVGVFNLSITPESVIEETHLRMAKVYHSRGGPWRRELLPRTVQVFVDENRKRAQAQAERAIAAYWKAMEGTIDVQKVEASVGNALVGEPDEVADQLQKRFHPDDRIMLWFDFNNHDSSRVEAGMKLFMEKVAPHFK